MKKSFWERYAFIYDTIVKKADKADIATAEYIAGFLSRNFRLLEAACGTGRFSCVLADYVREIVCCDYAENMVWQTQKKAQKRGITNMTFSVQDITSISFADNSFDASIAANVLHLLSSPETAISELKRVTADEGLIIIPNFVNAEIKNRAFLRFITFFGFQPKNEWTREDFLGFLTSNGLEIVDYKMFESTHPLCVAITKQI